MSIKDLTTLVQKPVQGGIIPKPPSEELLFNTLSNRHQANAAYTRAGPSTLVVVNPRQTLTDSSEASAIEIATRHRVEGDDIDPSPFDLACRAYSVMKGTGRSQAVVYQYVRIPRTLWTLLPAVLQWHFRLGQDTY